LEIHDTPIHPHVLTPLQRVTYLRHMPKNTQELIPTTEVADRLGVDVRTVHRMVARNELAPAIKTPGLRGAYMFLAADVAQFDSDRAA